MSETWFSDNYGDLSVMSGVNAGFQFEFFCERCHDVYRTRFQPYRKAQAAGWLGTASNVLGGLLGQADNAADSYAQSGWKGAWDDAFRESVVEARGHFNRCAQCFQHVCAKCFDVQSGLCYNCAPDAEVAMQAAKASGRAQGAAETGHEAGYSAGKGIDVKRDRQLVCPECGAETHGAKFCPECGTKLATTLQCAGCGHEFPQGTKFCPECGEKL
ncbi:MAG TPA: zinc ribbon domain-containing protein [Fimbriimonas sp.]